jgi:hypothetical protein
MTRDDAVDCSEQLNTLAKLLADSNTESEAYMRQNAAVLQPRLGDVWPVLQQHVVNFDFDQALAILQKALAG